MPGRHWNLRLHRLAPARRVVAFALLAGLLAMMFGASPAGAAAPKPSYTPGRDKATFTLNGVVDGNCPVSVGGTEVWIRPGDAIDFDSALAGINLNLVPLPQQILDVPLVGQLLGNITHVTTSQVAGLNIKGTVGGAPFRVSGGKVATISGLKAGQYKLKWQATSLALLPILHNSGLTAPLSSKQLRSGAKLSWTGTVYVTSGAPRCKLSVGTPKVDVNVGKLHLSVPPVRAGVTAPKLPKVPAINPTEPSGGKKTTAPTRPAGTGPKVAPAPLTGNGVSVPQLVVPHGTTGAALVGGGAGGAYSNAIPGLNLSSVTGGTSGTTTPGAAKAGASTPKQNSSGRHKTIDLASATRPSSGNSLSIILALLAIIALAGVTATYARLYVLRKPQA